MSASRTARRSSSQTVSSAPASLATSDADFGSLWYWVLVLLPVLFNAVSLAAELTPGVPSRNDSALHTLMIHSASEALRDGHNILDFWIPQLDLGFPQFLYYQHWPHLVIVALHRLLFGLVSLDTLFQTVTYLLLVCFPITVAWSTRRLGFSDVTAAVAGAAASLLSGSRAQYGFEYDSYLWRGLGLYTQLWAMHLSFVVLASASITVNEGRGHLRTALVMAALLLSHVIHGAMLIASCALLIPVGATKQSMLPRFARLAIPGVLALSVTSYFWWPFLQSGFLYVNSRPELLATPRIRRDDLSALLHGIVFDNQRWPVFTLMMTAGAIAAGVRRGRARLFVLIAMALWLLFYVEPPRGVLRTVLGEQGSRVRYRAIGPVHVFGIILIGLAGEALWSGVARLRTLSPRLRDALVTATIALLFVPAVIERHRAYRENAAIIASTRDAIARDPDQANVLEAIAANRGGRTSAGPPTGWGGTMRVGENSLSDMLNARRMAGVGALMQLLTMNVGLVKQIELANPAQLDLYDIRTVILPSTVAQIPPYFSPLFRVGRYTAWRVPTSGVATFVAVDRDTVARSQLDLWNVGESWFKSDAMVARRVTRIRYGPSRTTAPPFVARDNCASGTLRDERVSSQQVAVTVQCSAPSALMFKFNYHPNWRVQIDGVPAASYMVTPAFLAVDVPAGTHTVSAQYRPTPSKMPLLLFGLVTLALGVVFRSRLDAPAQWLTSSDSRSE